MSAVKKKQYSDFSVSEWFRLSDLAVKYERKLKTAYLQTVAQKQQANSLLVRNVITDTVLAVGVTTAPVYGMVFNPNSPRYRRLIDDLTDNYMKVVSNENTRRLVRDILPKDLSLSDRRNRLDVYGLDGRSAVLLERMRQRGADREDIERTRLDLSVRRGNLLALTETNRVINRALETVWIDNLQVSKADDVMYFDASVPRNVTSIATLPARARKEIITRRDDKVCDYCFPLDGLAVKLGAEFDTEYGLYESPPFHPRCRCFMVVSV